MDGDWLTWAEQQLAEWQELTSLSWQETALWAALIAAAAGILCAVLLRLRHTLRRVRLERSIRLMERRGGTAMMLEQLWQGIIRKHGPLRPGQTLREYVQTLELRKPDQKAALVELALLYESIRYDERLPERVSRGRMSRLWREALG